MLDESAPKTSNSWCFRGGSFCFSVHFGKGQIEAWISPNRYPYILAVMFWINLSAELERP